MRAARLIFSFILFIGIAWFGVHSVVKARALQTTKAQYAEINNFSYGLFSIDQWKGHLTQIVSDEIGGLSFKGQTGVELRKHLEKNLAILIDKVAARMKRENYKTTGGWLKQELVDSFVDVKEIKKGVPEYADAMMKELASPRTEKQIKSMLKQKVDKYMSTTFDKRDSAIRDALVAKYGNGDQMQAQEAIEEKLETGHDDGNKESLILIVLSVILFAVIGISSRNKDLHPPEYFLLCLTLLVLMFVGIMTPMIDMEAKIAKLSFVLMDHEITFKDQVLFFQSKSILDVFHIMITHKELQMKLVGCLLVTFSVIFPMLKLLSSMAYYYDYCEARKRKLIQFFVLKSGKWSMADVLVVAIFMAYIGFNGVINSQLTNIKKAAPDLSILTTNGTSLQPGYYVFMTFAILALFLSNFISTRTCGRDIKKAQAPV